MNARLLLTALALSALTIAACEVDDGPAAEEPGAATAPPADGEPAEDEAVAGVDEAALEGLLEAVENTMDEGSARFLITLGGDDPADTETGTGEGADAATGQQAAIRVGGEADFDAEQRELRFEGPQGQLTAIVDGDELYVQIPAAEDGEWARIQLDELAGQDATHGPAGLLMQDPHATLLVFEDAAAEVRETGTATDEQGSTPTPSPTRDEGGTTREDGSAATSAEGEADYGVVLDLTRVDDTHAQFRAFARQTGVEQIDVEVWADDEQRVEQVRHAVPTAGAQTGDEDAAATPTPTPDTEPQPQADLVVTVRYTDFGVRVDISTPPDDKVVDIDEAELGRSFGQDDGAAGRDGGSRTDG